jgi:phosphoglycerol transferase MdoB-like AlkP superfamily enzyme
LTTKYVDSLANNNYKVTPNLDRLVHEGVSFVNFFASGQRSVDGIQSIVTGVPPLPGMPNITSLSANYSRLAKLAETNGYQHIFITTTHRESFYLDAIAAAAGFSEYYGKEDFPIILDYPNDRDRWVGWDYEALMYLLQRIEEMQAPYFAFVNASADHTPFVELQPPFNQYEHGSDTEGGYLNMLHYTDWAIGEFIEKFKRRKDFDDTIFMITADHALAHFQSNDPYARFRVPLIVYAPKLIKPHSSQKFGAQTDLLPTIINLLDLEGSYATIGRDLFQPNPGFAVVKDGALVNIFTPQGFLQHSLKQIVDKQLTREDPSGSTKAGLEKKLIAFDHLTYHLLSKNRWFSQ